MNRRRFLGVAGALGAAAATGACGIPGSSEPRFLESGRPVEPQQRGAAAEPPDPAAASTPSDLVTNYLKAAAGANYNGPDKPDALAQAQARARSYLVNSAQQAWQPGKDLTVVRATVGTYSPAGTGAFNVNVRLVVVGVLTEQGAIEPTTNVVQSGPVEVVDVGSGYRLARAPAPFLLLSDEALRDYYTSQVIYFWDAPDSQMLVPDQRYLSKSTGSGKQPAEVLGWLRAGPSHWLTPVAAQPQPLDGVEVKDVSYNDQQRLIVNLSAKAANMEKEMQHRLAVQLRWSTSASGVELRIEDRPTGASSEDYVTYNASASRPDNASIDPERFCIAERKVRPVEATNNTQILDTDANADVVLAAIALRKRNAAFVRQEAKSPGKTQLRLWVGTLSGTGDTKAPTYARTNLASDSMSRPVWITRPSTQVLVAAGGEIHSVTPAEIQPTPLSLPKDFPTPITALAVSPEGRRIAVIARGELFVATLKFDSALSVGDAYRSIGTDLSDLRTVAWSAETKLLVGGAPIKDTKSGLVEITVNGAGQEVVPRDGTDGFAVDLVSARPAGPTGGARLAMLDANGHTAYNVYDAVIRPVQLVGVDPSPSVSPSGAPVAPRLSAPFFLD